MDSFALKTGIFLIVLGAVLSFISLFSGFILSAFLSISGKIIIALGMAVVYMGKNEN